MNILVFGNGNAGINISQYIYHLSDHKVLYIHEFGLNPAQKSFREIKFDSSKDTELELAQSSSCDVIISSGWHRKIPLEMINQFPCYNIHPSLLPKYRGINPLEFQLYNHEKTGGVTLHKMDEGFDSGPIYKQLSFNIESNDTLTSLMIKACRCARKLVKDFFIEFPNITCFQQDETKATYYSLSDTRLLYRD